MILVFDTETTGFPDFKARSADPLQPHLVQIALVMCDDQGNEVKSTSAIIRPDGWLVTAEMTKIHGISHEQAMDEGIAEKVATDMFMSAHEEASLRVAHVESFDRRIMRIAMTRAGIDRPIIDAIEAKPHFCTANKSAGIINLPPSEKMAAKNMKMRKTPTLAECILHFFGEELADAHTALADARACARVWKALTIKEITG
jgi:DNA polymerase-3 subunit epsilon